MTKLILIHKINKFYHIFWEVLDYDFEPRISNFDDDFLLQVLFDINEALKANSTCFCEEAYDLDVWLNKLKIQIINYRDKVAPKIIYRIWCVFALILTGWLAYSCLEVMLKSMSDINIFTIIAKFNGLM